jgi:hypothetical protein
MVSCQLKVCAAFVVSMDAISEGANPAALRQRLIQKGIDPFGL